ncbi:lytic transglycosylase domain-containing protein [Myxococcota bacterium]|nr:lytic transglycosylase domain-containing protein [Myxococcota bacterium]
MTLPRLLATALALAGPVTASLPAAGAALPSAGTVLPQAPAVPPGTVPPSPADPLALARERWHQGDVAGTITLLSPWLEGTGGPGGRARTAGHLLLGLAHVERQNWNLASAHFFQVRRSADPLAPWGAWYEAVVDHERGRHEAAISECTSYRERWPEGQHADECLVLVGEAWAALGKPGAAVSAFQTWLDHNPDTPRTEEIELAKAVAVARTDPRRGIPMLHELVLVHTFPSTAVGAQQALDELRQQGHDITMPSDLQSRMRYAHSLRRSGKLVEAWTLFQQLQAEADRVDAEGRPLDPALQRWVDDNEESFSWGTRRFDVWVQGVLPRYEAQPSARLGWRIMRAYERGGMYAEAAAWGARMERDWGDKSNREHLAWATLHAGDYVAARERWSQLGRTGGKLGRDARFYAAFSAFRGGEHDLAIAELGAIYEEGKEDAGRAAWWRARAHAAKGEAELAAQWRLAARADDTGWYRLLAQDHDWRAAGAPPPPTPADARTATEAWMLRDGAWHGHHPPVLLPPAATQARAAPTPGRARSAALDAPPGNDGWAHLRWTGGSLRADGGSPPPAAHPLAPPSPLPVALEALPDGYGACTWYDPATAEATFQALSTSLSDLLPDLPAAYDLARAGQSTDAGRILREAWEQWEQARGRSDAASQRLQAVRIGDWRDVTIFARQAHLSYRVCTGLHKHAESAEDELDAWRLAYPMVRTPELWRHGRVYGVDPFLVMGIMRQESTYQATVVSHAGAIGLVQVMPRTGAKVAALLGEGRYSPAALENPATNLRYGTYYLSLLLKRFGGSFPLAVASYNGGPHNMGRWLRPWLVKGEPIELDAFVEQIEYDESRDYVKKVSAYYATYVRLYGPPGARVVIPTHPAQDDPSVVDF